MTSEDLFMPWRPVSAEDCDRLLEEAVLAVKQAGGDPIARQHLAEVLSLFLGIRGSFWTYLRREVVQELLVTLGADAITPVCLMAREAPRVEIEDDAVCVLSYIGQYSPELFEQLKVHYNTSPEDSEDRAILLRAMSHSEVAPYSILREALANKRNKRLREAAAMSIEKHRYRVMLTALHEQLEHEDDVDVRISILGAIDTISGD